MDGANFEREDPVELIANLVCGEAAQKVQIDITASSYLML
jgi:hypothetical protein